MLDLEGVSLFAPRKMIQHLFPLFIFPLLNKLEATFCPYRSARELEKEEK
jgi:hypothetical protein